MIDLFASCSDCGFSDCLFRVDFTGRGELAERQVNCEENSPFCKEKLTLIGKTIHAVHKCVQHSKKKKNGFVMISSMFVALL